MHPTNITLITTNIKMNILCIVLKKITLQIEYL